MSITTDMGSPSPTPIPAKGQLPPEVEQDLQKQLSSLEDDSSADTEFEEIDSEGTLQFDVNDAGLHVGLTNTLDVGTKVVSEVDLYVGVTNGWADFNHKFRGELKINGEKYVLSLQNGKIIGKREEVSYLDTRGYKDPPDARAEAGLFANDTVNAIPNFIIDQWLNGLVASLFVLVDREKKASFGVGLGSKKGEQIQWWCNPATANKVHSYSGFGCNIYNGWLVDDDAKFPNAMKVEELVGFINERSRLQKPLATDVINGNTSPKPPKKPSMTTTGLKLSMKEGTGRIGNVEGTASGELTFADGEMHGTFKDARVGSRGAAPFLDNITFSVDGAKDKPQWGHVYAPQNGKKTVWFPHETPGLGDYVPSDSYPLNIEWNGNQIITREEDGTLEVWYSSSPYSSRVPREYAPLSFQAPIRLGGTLSFIGRAKLGMGEKDRGHIFGFFNLDLEDFFYRQSAEEASGKTLREFGFDARAQWARIGGEKTHLIYQEPWLSGEVRQRDGDLPVITHEDPITIGSSNARLQLGGYTIRDIVSSEITLDGPSSTDDPQRKAYSFALMFNQKGWNPITGKINVGPSIELEKSESKKKKQPIQLEDPEFNECKDPHAIELETPEFNECKDPQARDYLTPLSLPTRKMKKLHSPLEARMADVTFDPATLNNLSGSAEPEVKDGVRRQSHIGIGSLIFEGGVYTPFTKEFKLSAPLHIIGASWRQDRVDQDKTRHFLQFNGLNINIPDFTYFGEKHRLSAKMDGSLDSISHDLDRAPKGVETIVPLSGKGPLVTLLPGAYFNWDAEGQRPVDGHASLESVPTQFTLKGEDKTDKKSGKIEPTYHVIELPSLRADVDVKNSAARVSLHSPGTTPPDFTVPEPPPLTVVPKIRAIPDIFPKRKGVSAVFQKLLDARKLFTHVRDDLKPIIDSHFFGKTDANFTPFGRAWMDSVISRDIKVSEVKQVTIYSPVAETEAATRVVRSDHPEDVEARDNAIKAVNELRNWYYGEIERRKLTPPLYGNPEFDALKKEYFAKREKLNETNPYAVGMRSVGKWDEKGQNTIVHPDKNGDNTQELVFVPVAKTENGEVQFDIHATLKGFLEVLIDIKGMKLPLLIKGWDVDHRNGRIIMRAMDERDIQDPDQLFIQKTAVELCEDEKRHGKPDPRDATLASNAMLGLPGDTFPTTPSGITFALAVASRVVSSNNAFFNMNGFAGDDVVVQGTMDLGKIGEKDPEDMSPQEKEKAKKSKKPHHRFGIHFDEPTKLKHVEFHNLEHDRTIAAEGDAIPEMVVQYGGLKLKLFNTNFKYDSVTKKNGKDEDGKAILGKKEEQAVFKSREAHLQIGDYVIRIQNPAISARLDGKGEKIELEHLDVDAQVSVYTTSGKQVYLSKRHLGKLMKQFKKIMKSE